MKRNIYYILFTSLCLVFGVWSCEEEEGKKPLVADNTPPDPISEVSVSNQPGGARISYSIPTNDDALYVEATFVRNGNQVTARSSIYKNFLDIEGLKGGQNQEVEIVVVDRSDNKSSVVKAAIEPQRSPIEKLFDSFELIEDFGGVRIRYNNEDNVRAELLLYAKDENGNLNYQQSAFIENDDKDFHIYRGFPVETNTFGVVAVDRWDNITDTIKAELLPLLEVELDKDFWVNVNLPSDEPPAWGTQTEGLWDLNYTWWGNGLHTDANTSGPTILPYDQYYHMFTIDLGVTAKLSRFKFFQRVNGWQYRHGNPRRFELWGIDQLPDNASESFEGWTRLVKDGEVIKPSRLPLGELSEADIAQAASGEEYVFSIDAPNVRYIRYVTLETWSGGTFMHLNELEFFGQIEE
ncbi:DUF5000 domain-containing lipoprotein [Fulvivirgaceae bacterium BMA10]|uniref:DUF5000 domain-containing lipoprotein n=1 Tax=Splendidivirga corallicola TaxID=3051826 RepID=A0ABT8KU06_9BACT|nr:DUF5000 domain-containing lipoprotein [Fulvivirgaceae bacterium BMA10]